MRCLNNCPERAIEAAHGMAILFWLIFTALNAQLVIFIINTLNIQPDVWWWKLVSNIIGIGGMVLITTILYRIMHFIMGYNPVKYIIRYTSLTALPFWRRYRYLNNKKQSTLFKRK
jgi:hypothetical protein